MSNASSPSFHALAAALEASGTPFVVATVVDTGGSTPRLAGAQMLVEPNHMFGTIGGGAFEYRVIEEARALLDDPSSTSKMYAVHLVRDLAMCCGGKMSVFLNKHEPEPQLRIYGAGHIGTELAFLAQRAGFKVTCVDARAEWANSSRFPAEVEVLDEEPEDHLHAASPTQNEYIVVCTHAHDLDEALVRRLLESDAKYLGLVGSRGKWARFQKRFESRGLNPSLFERVRCPVGLDISAETPAEIAVSILAELVASRRVRRDAPGESSGRS